MLWWVFLFVFLVFLYVRVLKPHQYWKEHDIVYEKPMPIVGNMGRFLFRRTSFAEIVQELYNKFPNRYFGFYQFLLPTLMLRDIELIKQIAIKNFDNFIDHRTFISEETDPLFGKNLFSLKGQKWRNMRSTLSPAFTSSKMRSMFVLISECSDQFTNYFLKNADSNKPIELEMKEVFTRFANDVIATTAFGIKCDSLEEKNNAFYIMGKNATEFTGLKGLKFFGYSFSPLLMKLFKIKLFDDDVSNFFRNIVKTTITTREQKGIVRPDMIHLLMEARKGQLNHEETLKNKDADAGFATVEESEVGKEVKNGKPELTDDDITAQALLFFFAGFDTISTLMCHVANELALNVDIQQRLYEEITTTIEECGGKITYDALMNMKYLDMVISETLRKWPPSPITDRQCTKSFTIQPEDSTEKPLTLVKGDVIWLPVFAIHRDPKYFPEPERFDPERFNDDNKDNIKPFSYLPFGVGPRNCIGSRFALMEAKIVFVHLLSKFELVVTKKTQIPLVLTRSTLNMIGEKGIWVGFKPRNKKNK